MPLPWMRAAALSFALALSPAAFAADVAPLAVTPAEGLTYWRPAPGAFSPSTRADPKRVAFAEEVTLAYTITKRGRTADVQVIDAKPAGAHTGWAVSAIQAMRFEPTERNAARTPIRSQITSRWDGPARK
ncbi:hypothetical protein [Stenotrophomonas sp.]|uniref:hypothetical protein n=1 Tax=Stenotrophomonas sp. TaxID=69392 RepID=UPI002FC5F5E3